MTVRLRAHHLLCLLTYMGRGYTPAFTTNYDALAKRIRDGEGIRIVAGPDDICAPLLDDPQAHCRRQSAVRRDRAAAQAVTRLLSRPVETDQPFVMDAATVARLRAAFADGSIRAACVGCEWASLCSAIAADGYPQTRL